MRRTVLIVVFVLGFVSFLDSLAVAQNKVVVIPLLGDETPAPVEKTGQTKCYEYGSGTEIGCSGTGEDGEYQKGVTWPTPRFTDNENGTVTDNLTGLIWLKNADCYGSTDWGAALGSIAYLRAGYCGLTDGSSAGDWRLPNLKELLSLNDYGRIPALPFPHPFEHIWSDVYWSSTTHAVAPSHAWGVIIYYGNVYHYDKEFPSNDCRVWPVRGGN